MDAYTVVEPWTMVIKALDAPVADGTVARSRRPQDRAVRAHLAWVHR